MRAACLALLLAGTAAAQTPFLTDDAEVTYRGRAHIEWTHEWASLSKSARPAQHQFASVLDVKWGILPNVEFGFDVPILLITGADFPEGHGLGDLDFAAKATLLEEIEGSERPGIAVSATYEIPTGDSADGTGSGETDFSLNFIVAKSLGAGWTLTLNLGAVLAGNTLTGATGLPSGTGTIYTGGLSLKKDVGENLVVGLVVWGAKGVRAEKNDSELRVQLGANWSVGRVLSIVASASAGWRESPTATGLVGCTVDF